MTEFAPQTPQDPEYSEAEILTIEEIMEKRNVSFDDAVALSGLRQAFRPVYQSKRAHPSNYTQPRRSGFGPNHGEEALPAVDTDLSDEQGLINRVGVAKVREELRKGRDDDSYQRALDRARDERRGKRV